MATKENDVNLPFKALQLLAPPVRLVSAALYKVMKQRDVMQYGVVEEFVTSACETVPGLLTVRHQGKLALGLRGRLILELCCKQPDEKVIMPHLERIRAPAALSHSSASTMKRDVNILKTVESFHSLVHTLLTDPAEREQFFKEEFPLDYGPKFDQELEKLLWEFLIRLDQLLPVPNLAQTVSWLSDAPPVLEECARAATQPQLLKVLLQHQACLGHLETAASLPPNMGDSILASLSLPPSGRVSTNQPTGAKRSAVDTSDGTRTREKTQFVTPVIGLISNEDVPVMISANKRTLSGDPKEKFTVVKRRQNRNDDRAKEGAEKAQKRRSAIKRKQPHRQSESDEELMDMIESGKKTISFPNGAGRGEEEEEEGVEDGGKTVVETSRTELGVKSLRLPEDPSLRSIFVSCLTSQPRVVVVKTQAYKSTSGKPQRPDSDVLGLDDKENHPVLPSVSSAPSQQRRNTETSASPGDSEDYVADSEDEATKNFKGRLFTKRYYKTKHGTYVPTLREYWKPGMTWRDLSAPGKRRR